MSTLPGIWTELRRQDGGLQPNESRNLRESSMAGLETGLGLGRQQTRFHSRFLYLNDVFSQIDTDQNLHQHYLTKYLILFAPLCLKISVLFIGFFTQYGVAWHIMVMCHTSWCCMIASGLLLVTSCSSFPQFSSRFGHFDWPFLDWKLEVFPC